MVLWYLPTLGYSWMVMCKVYTSSVEIIWMCLCAAKKEGWKHPWNTRSVGLGCLVGKCLLDLQAGWGEKPDFFVLGVCHAANWLTEEWLMLSLDGLCWDQKGSFPASSCETGAGCRQTQLQSVLGGTLLASSINPDIIITVTTCSSLPAWHSFPGLR